MQLDFNATTMTETQTAPVEEDLKLKEASKNPNEAIEIDDDDMEEGIVYFAFFIQSIFADLLKDSNKGRGSMLNNFALKPKHFNLGFSGTLRSLFEILLREYFFFH